MWQVPGSGTSSSTLHLPGDDAVFDPSLKQKAGLNHAQSPLQVAALNECQSSRLLNNVQRGPITD